MTFFIGLLLAILIAGIVIYFDKRSKSPKKNRASSKMKIIVPGTNSNWWKNTFTQSNKRLFIWIIGGFGLILLFYIVDRNPNWTKGGELKITQIVFQTLPTVPPPVPTVPRPVVLQYGTYLFKKDLVYYWDRESEMVYFTPVNPGKIILYCESQDGTSHFVYTSTKDSSGTVIAGVTENHLTGLTGVYTAKVLSEDVDITYSNIKQ